MSELAKFEILRLSDYCKKLESTNNKYYEELSAIAKLNYHEWYDSFYKDHIDVYKSSESLVEIWHNASQGNDPQILDVIVCINQNNLDVLGMCALEYNELEPHCPPENINTSKIYLTNLLVHPGARSQGIACKLIQYCREWLQMHRPDLAAMYLNCQEKLVNFYIQRGWKLSDTETGLPDWYEMFTNTVKQGLLSF